jgi:ribosomal protein S18 acetylase RimI-like enzyme
LSLNIKSCSVNEIIPIRHEILRAGKPITTCHFKGDDNPKTYHFGAYKEDEIVGCVSFMPKNHSDFIGQKPYQLRGMAVLENQQNQSIGLHLLQYAEHDLKNKGVDLIWCNVRIKAIGFYKRQNFETDSKKFTIPEIGEHVLMYKYI